MLALMDMSEAISDNTWVLVPLAVFTFLTIGAIVDGVRKVMQTRSREDSRREIAAYVAEGSMTTEDAERLLAAGGKAEGKSRCG
jgi:hypothetical protein